MVDKNALDNDSRELAIVTFTGYSMLVITDGRVCYSCISELFGIATRSNSFIAFTELTWYSVTAIFS